MDSYGWLVMVVLGWGAELLVLDQEEEWLDLADEGGYEVVERRD